jgi:hypothetical protein
MMTKYLFLVFKQTACHLTAEANVEQVGQLSEVNLDPDALADMFSIMVNKLAYKTTVKAIMDKYYEMFRGKISASKKDFFNSPDSRTRRVNCTFSHLLRLVGSDQKGELD